HVQVIEEVYPRGEGGDIEGRLLGIGSGAPDQHFITGYRNKGNTGAGGSRALYHEVAACRVGIRTQNDLCASLRVTQDGAVPVLPITIDGLDPVKGPGSWFRQDIVVGGLSAGSQFTQVMEI